jgi:hypothetical protein
MTKAMQFTTHMRDVHGVVDDFHHFPSNTNGYATGPLAGATPWELVISNSGTCVVADGDTGGVVKLYPSSAENSEADNDEIYLMSRYETFVFANGKPLVYETKVKPLFNTSTGINVLMGLMDAVAADHIQDDGDGPAASYSGAVIFLKDGDATWYCESSIAGAQTTVDSNITATNNTWTTLRIEVYDRSSTVQEVHYFIDGVECGWDMTTLPGTKLAQTINPTSATDMHVVAAVKNGEADDSQWAFIDYIQCEQKR